MATLADKLKRTVYRGRGLAGSYGFREHTVERITRYKSSPRGLVDESIVPIVEADNQPPRVRWLKSEEITVGGLAEGTIEIGPTTPNAALDAWLQGEGLAAGDERFIRITGPQAPKGDLYRVTRWQADRPLRRVIQAQPVEQGFP